MKTNSAWVRTWIVASVVWGAVLIGFTVNLLAKPPSFEMATSEPCPQLMLRPMPKLEVFIQKIDPRLFFKVVIWRDAKTREELYPYRKGEQALSCSTLEARAQLFLAGARAGIIEPQIYLRTKLLMLIIVLSSLLLAPVVYLLHLPFARKQAKSRDRHERRGAI
jgi:hypothetical protein